MSVPAFEEAYEKVSKLAATFQANEARYLSPDYQEAEARKDFIDKFFIALGWDVNHDQQTNPYEQEVKVVVALNSSYELTVGRERRIPPVRRTLTVPPPPSLTFQLTPLDLT